MTGVQTCALPILPTAKSIGYLRNPANPVYAEAETREVEGAARDHRVRLVLANASTSGEIDTAFADLAQQRVDALQVSGDGFLLTHPDQPLSAVHDSWRSHELWNEYS